jgi:hypothetical protein
LRSAGIYRRGHALRPLLEAAAVLILARQAGGGELEPGGVFSLANAGATGMLMAGGHGVMVRGHALRHFTGGMHWAGVHEEHRRQSQLRPNHHDHEQGRRDGFLHHRALSMTGGLWDCRDGDHTPMGVSGRCLTPHRNHATRFCRATRNSRKWNLYPLASSFPG